MMSISVSQILRLCLRTQTCLPDGFGLQALVVPLLENQDSACVFPRKYDRIAEIPPNLQMIRFVLTPKISHHPHQQKKLPQKIKPEHWEKYNVVPPPDSPETP